VTFVGTESVSAARRAGRPERLAEYVRRARAGDTAALDEIVVELNPLLWHVARAQGLASEDAADVVQTTWLELVRQLDSIRSPMALTAWLVQTTKREAWHVTARQRKRPTVGGDELPDLPDEAVPDMAARVVALEEHRVLWRYFGQLSERCQELLRVVAQGNAPDYAAIAQALGMPHGSIGPTRGRCLAKLRELLLADPEWSAE
jgi:RNA polymerase sigma factor (sigma-70 family)